MQRFCSGGEGDSGSWGPGGDRAWGLTKPAKQVRSLSSGAERTTTTAAAATTTDSSSIHILCYSRCCSYCYCYCYCYWHWHDCYCYCYCYCYRYCCASSSSSSSSYYYYYHYYDDVSECKCDNKWYDEEHQEEDNGRGL